MGIAAAGDQLLDGNIARGGGVLRQQADASGDVLAGVALDLLAVDFPQPLGPMMAVKWPSGMVTFSDSAMIFLPYARVNWSPRKRGVTAVIFCGTPELTVQ
jgi:hypothetical protein